MLQICVLSNTPLNWYDTHVITKITVTITKKTLLSYIFKRTHHNSHLSTKMKPVAIYNIVRPVASLCMIPFQRSCISSRIPWQPLGRVAKETHCHRRWEKRRKEDSGTSTWDEMSHGRRMDHMSEADAWWQVPGDKGNIEERQWFLSL